VAIKVPNLSSSSLAGKKILITGAGRGIGKQAALSYAAHGAELILLGKTVKHLEATYDEIMAAGGLEPGIIPLDMQGATAKNYQDMAAMLVDQYGHLDGLLFNASVLGNLCPFTQIEADEFNEVMQVNLNSQFHMTQALLPVLQKAAAASLIYTTSSVGRTGRAYWGTYSISKFATEGMMQVLADEYKNSSVRINCLNPGATQTDMRAKAFPAEKSAHVTPAIEIMPYYIFLMSDASKSVNGESIDCQPK
jgi:NAD(P)-dependent dehydrogenase (short-subunit alcohol dehydrogenase family)